MDNPTVTNLTVTVVVLGWLLSRQLVERPLRERSPVGLVLIVIGGLETGWYVTAHPLSLRDGVLAAVSLAVGVALAAVRAYTVRLSVRGDRVVRKGTPLTAALWVAGLGQHFLISAAIAAGIGEVSVLFYFGVVLLAQQRVLVARAATAGLADL
ncbi:MULTISPECIES: hypothetical protein [unclassified Streptomyces]|uniref:hypothetical protein n=1 Tax=unclassified Streptomyces TaxID=2593676 RepID=UPI000C27AE18|nr:hypothetical protein [Streptomyces sp. CB02959]PJN38727.1 hypothetical protein CG747_21840 [Streptomyces sp. CB02959]